MDLVLSSQECLDRIGSMCDVECRFYGCSNYLEYLCNTPQGLKKSNSLERHRGKICAWMYQLLDTFEVDRQIVYTGMNFLDRFLSNVVSQRHESDFSIDNYISGGAYELASLTALYLAIKLNGSSSAPTDISKFELLCRHKFTAEHIRNMELEMMTGLSWYLHPPSPTQYVINFVALMTDLRNRRSTRLSHEEIETVAPDFDRILDISVFLTELSVGDYFFVTESAAIVAYAAVLTTIYNIERCIDEPLLQMFDFALGRIGFRDQSTQARRCMSRLTEIYGEQYPTEVLDDQVDYSRSSPVSVSQI